MNFVLLAWLTYLLTDLHYDRQLVNTLLVTAWGLRLGVFLLYRVLLRGHDARFDKMRDDCMKFFVFWVFQMFWVYIVSLPVMFLNAAELDSPINGWDYFGWALWAFGFLFESWADFSKNSHSNDPAMKGKILMSGPWAITRHPNYFGEIIIWLGIFISASQVFQDNTEWGYISLLSPAFTYFLLMFASGVPLGEDRYGTLHC